MYKKNKVNSGNKQTIYVKTTASGMQWHEPKARLKSEKIFFSNKIVNKHNLL